MYIDFNVFLYVIQSKQLRHFILNYKNDTTHKAKFWLGFGEQLSEFLKSFSLSQSDGL